MKIYSKGQLLKFLRERNLRCSYPTLRRYEEIGVIPKPKMIEFNDRSWRVYFAEDLQRIANAIGDYVAKERLKMLEKAKKYAERKNKKKK